MNVQIPSSKAAQSKPPQPPRRERVDQEFLPAALEILETPPSPIGVWLLWSICILAVAALGWAYFGRIDVVAVAQGKIQPTGRVKVIQPLETGRASAVLVENGEHVRKGQVLVAFDSADADADVNQLAADLSSVEAEAARRQAALVSIGDRIIKPIAPIEWVGEIPADTKARETHVLAGDLEKLVSAIAGLEAQQRQKQRERDRFAATSAAVEDLVATLQQRVDMRLSLQNSGSGSKGDLIEAVQTLQEQKATLATARGQILESEAAIEVLSRSIEDAYRTFSAENLEKLADAERRIDEDTQKLAKVRARQSRMVLSSPIEGTVSSLSITTPGQVIAAGEEVMRIVPDGIGIEIEAYIPNRDIGFVKPGQDAVVKIESLPFTRYGTIEAKLSRVAGDAIPQPDAERTEGNPIQATRQAAFAGAERTQNLVFPAIFQPASTVVMADGALVPLSAGMAVTIEIKTGNRRILEYLFSPLLEVANEAMKER
jgi:hemolysin D